MRISVAKVFGPKLCSPMLYDKFSGSNDSISKKVFERRTWEEDMCKDQDHWP